MNQKDAQFLKEESLEEQKSKKTKNKGFEGAFHELQMKRKLFLHEVFKKRIILSELIRRKKDFQQDIIKKYE